MTYPEILPANLIPSSGGLTFTSEDGERWCRMRKAIVEGDDSFMQAIENYPYADPDHPTAAELDAAVDSAKVGVQHHQV